MYFILRFCKLRNLKLIRSVEIFRYLNSHRHIHTHTSNTVFLVTLNISIFATGLPLFYCRGIRKPSQLKALFLSRDYLFGTAVRILTCSCPCLSAGIPSPCEQGSAALGQLLKGGSWLKKNRFVLQSVRGWKLLQFSSHPCHRGTGEGRETKTAQR